MDHVFIEYYIIDPLLPTYCDRLWNQFYHDLYFQTDLFKSKSAPSFDSRATHLAAALLPQTVVSIFQTFFKKMGQSWPLFVYFSFFSGYNFNNTNWKKCRWCAWDSNPGPQDGRRRRNHGAMVATFLGIKPEVAPMKCAFKVVAKSTLPLL